MEYENYETLAIMSIILILAEVGAFLFGFIECFWGYKIKRAICVVSGILIGVFTGLAVSPVMVSAFDSSSVSLICIAVGALLFVVLAYRFYKFGVFLCVTFNVTSFMMILIWVLEDYLYMSDIEILKILSFNTSAAWTLSIIVGVVIGILSIIWEKPVFLITTSVSGGAIASGVLVIGVLIRFGWYFRSAWFTALIIMVVLSILGLIVQIKTNNGLSERKEPKQEFKYNINRNAQMNDTILPTAQEIEAVSMTAPDVIPPPISSGLTDITDIMDDTSDFE